MKKAPFATHVWRGGKGFLLETNLSIYPGKPDAAPFFCAVLDFAGFFDPTRCDDGAKIVFPENARMTYIVDDPVANAVRPCP